MVEWIEKNTRVLLQQQLLQLCARDITEESLLTMKGLIDTFLYKKEQKYADEMIEEFGCTRYDFDEWLHDPGK